MDDRLSHDRRYAIDAKKIKEDLGWAPLTKFEEGIKQTIAWYCAHASWIARIRSGEYRV